MEFRPPFKSSRVRETPDLNATDDALIIVDVQNDFCPGGALPIANGDAVVPVLNRWMACAYSAGVAIFASRDWHPVKHVSFVECGGPWPPHCIQGSHGADFHRALQLPKGVILITKGDRHDHDQNSAFDQTSLLAELRRKHVRRVWIGGLAEDVCVRATALDAVAAGFEVWVITDGTRPVTAEGGAQARRTMETAGIHFTEQSDAGE